MVGRSCLENFQETSWSLHNQQLQLRNFYCAHSGCWLQLPLLLLVQLAAAAGLQEYSRIFLTMMQLRIWEYLRIILVEVFPFLFNLLCSIISFGCFYQSWRFAVNLNQVSMSSFFERVAHNFLLRRHFSFDGITKSRFTFLRNDFYSFWSVQVDHQLLIILFRYFLNMFVEPVRRILQICEAEACSCCCRSAPWRSNGCTWWVILYVLILAWWIQRLIFV